MNKSQFWELVLCLLVAILAVSESVLERTKGCVIFPQILSVPLFILTASYLGHWISYTIWSMPWQQWSAYCKHIAAWQATDASKQQSLSWWKKTRISFITSFLFFFFSFFFFFPAGLFAFVTKRQRNAKNPIPLGKIGSNTTLKVRRKQTYIFLISTIN